MLLFPGLPDKYQDQGEGEEQKQTLIIHAGVSRPNGFGWRAEPGLIRRDATGDSAAGAARRAAVHARPHDFQWTRRRNASNWGETGSDVPARGLAGSGIHG